MSYTTGRQPCHDFKPRRENNGYGEWDNEHQCPICRGLRSFCENCSADHHFGGWSDCDKLRIKTTMTNKEKIEMISDCLNIPKDDVAKWDEQTIDIECFKLCEDPDNI